ncbi:MAG: AAA family ATPase [Thermodesulfovibrionales bacterium]|nr:AAA family ATPase [Thermodesulfovibrionales bacterium]
MGKVITGANQKGGVGKTTTAINLSTSIALDRRYVLVIDSDPQGNLTSGFGIDRDSLNRTLYDVYIERCKLEESVIKSSIEYLSIVPSSINLLAIELELANTDGREQFLNKALGNIRDDYDFIFIDCPPSLGLLTLNALVAADSVLIPVQCEYYSLEGLSLLYKTYKRVKGSFNPKLELEGIILTMYDARTSLSQQVAREVRKYFKEKVYQTLIPRNVTLSEAPSHGKPAILYNIKSKGSQSYLSLAMEVLHENGIR